MPYGSTGRLATERASKLGLLDLTGSPWLRDLIESFDHDPPPPEAAETSGWWPVPKAEPLGSVWAVDGSLAVVRNDARGSQRPPREVAFVKVALLHLDAKDVRALDPDAPHPLALQDLLRDAAIFLPAAFPLRHVRTGRGNNLDAVRNLAHEALTHHFDGRLLDTLGWLAWRTWHPDGPTASPAFECPHGDHEVPGFPPDIKAMPCPTCGGPLLLTDLVGLHLDMDDDEAPAAVAKAYMLVAEHLMLFTPVRLLWDRADPTAVGRPLFLRDGPLTLKGQYSKLVGPIRDFLQHAKDAGRPIHMAGQEKTGAFVDHLAAVAPDVPPADPGGPAHYKVLTHGRVRREVQRRGGDPSDYGFRVNWGEKLLLKLPPHPHTRLVLSVPPGRYVREEDAPAEADLIGLGRVLATVATLVSRRHEGGLYPIELAHGVASLSSYPSAKVLERLLDGPV